MKLLDNYEALFQYMCLLSRIAKARPEAHPEYAQVRADIRALLEDLERGAAADVRLSNQIKRLELPVVFFIDNIICTSKLKFAQQWAGARLAIEKRNELAGDERFFDFVTQDLPDTSEEAAERLAVYYTCFGLGFTGMYVSQPKEIRNLQEQIFPRIRQWADSDRVRISEEAYKPTDTRTLTEPASNKIIFVAILFVFLCLASLLIYCGLYREASSDLSQSIKAIKTHAQP